MEQSIIINQKTKFLDLPDNLYRYDNLIKAVVDIEKKRLAIGGKWHADCELLLANSGSNSVDNWGFNIYFDDKHIEYNSMINIKPQLGSKSMTLVD